MKTTVLAIGRWMPIHLGHKQFLVRLAKQFDRLIIGIGSCYQNGTVRNCIPALSREKLLRKMLAAEGVTNVTILHIGDSPTFEEWFTDVAEICKTYNVTHFCTGNKEDILDVMQKTGLTLDTEMINPEDTSDFPYHATDIRNAILDGKTELLDSMIPPEIKPMVLSQVAKEIKLCAKGEGKEFIPGYQTVDMVFTVKQGDEHYLLVGRRNEHKIDFANCTAIPGGGIEKFESPTDAVIRCFFAETGIRLCLLDNTDEPATVSADGICERASLHFTDIYASDDESVNGTRGGGSQCFAMCIEGDPDAISKQLFSRHDMTELYFINVNDVYKTDFAFDQKRMIFDSLCKLSIPYDNGELLEMFDDDFSPCGKGVSRSHAHREGILHGASHIYLYKRTKDGLCLLFSRRSENKDSYPGMLDTSSAGHIELGSDFEKTACRELYEELGLTVDASALTELFTQTITHDETFYGKHFFDREVNRIYALEWDGDETALELQAAEVSEAIWLTKSEIIARLESEDCDICTYKPELLKVLKILDK